MIYSIRVIVYLKNMDLHAMSALQVLQSEMNVDYLTSLRRFICWDLDVQAASEEEAKCAVEAVIQRSYFLLNENKEGYWFDGLPTRNRSGESEYVVYQVKNKVAEDFTDLCASIDLKFNLKVTGLQKSLLWEIGVKGISHDALQERLLQDVLVTTSQKKGLLLNPLHEEGHYLPVASCYVAH